MANTRQEAAKPVRPFLGSVDDMLLAALESRFSDAVPRPGEVDFIAAGSPCPGFSTLTMDKTTDDQVKNRSLVASVASFVDFYRPKYGILENVPNIVQRGAKREEDVFSQLICAIVGMGYQAQIVLGGAWSHGAPQSRERVFLYFAAPGLPLPEAPVPSHSHFQGTKERGLGVMANGEPYVKRNTRLPTPFKFVSAAASTADLPPIYDGKADLCIPFPDHRLSVGMSAKRRDQYAVIPTHPYGMNFAAAWRMGDAVMTPAERELFPATGERVDMRSKAWGRVHPDEVFSTISTASHPVDSRIGRSMHWHEAGR
jgi:DNA (cytosine-5)-methyltransferase 1